MIGICKMLVCVTLKLTVITMLCNPLVHCNTENYIFTKFDDLETYFEQTMAELDYMSSKDLRQLRPWHPRTLCSDLFGTRRYQIQGEATNFSVENKNITEISHEDITDELMSRVQFKNSMAYHNHSVHVFPLSRDKQIDAYAYVCFDVNEKEKWKVIFKAIYLSGFLFEISANSQLPTLKALIDLYYVVPLIRDKTKNELTYVLKYYSVGSDDVRNKTIKQSAMESEFQDSLKKLVFGAKDPLCALNENLQFRLCSMGADALYKSGENSYKFTYNAKRKYEYFFENFYHPKNNPDEICPKITIDFEVISFTEVQHRALLCDVSIQKNKFRFYLSYSIKGKTGMFIIIRKGNRFIIETLLEVPLLYRLRMKDFDKIYSDEIFKKFQGSIKL